jgi:hypothetical protein
MAVRFMRYDIVEGFVGGCVAILVSIFEVDMLACLGLRV